MKINNLIFFIVIFCYIFSFYIVIPIGFLFFPFFLIYVLVNEDARKKLYLIISQKRVFFLFLFLLILVFLSILFSIFHGTYDLTYTQTLINQGVYLILGLLIAACFYKKFLSENIINYIILAFVVQTFIQLIVFEIPALQDIMFFFNKADDFASEGYKGIRGLALSSGTGWNLSLSYGLVFIIAFYYLNQRNNLLIPIIYIFLLFVGCFFAGRTGYLGLFLGLFLFLISSNSVKKLRLSIIIPVVILLSMVIISLVPNLYSSLEEKVFPFVFEFYYNYESSGRVETGSTNVLMDMWKVEYDPDKLLLGYGFFTDPYTGAYFKKIDVGILRNLFYWGIFGYIFVIFYQAYFFWIIYYYIKKFENKSLILVLLLFFYLCIAEIKAMTLGYNKMAISIIFLLLMGYVIKSINLKVKNV